MERGAINRRIVGEWNYLVVGEADHQLRMVQTRMDMDLKSEVIGLRLTNGWKKLKRGGRCTEKDCGPTYRETLSETCSRN